MGRRLGSGNKKIYVSFRTTEAHFYSMMRIAKIRNLTKSKVYRCAEAVYINANKSLLNQGLAHGIKSKLKKKKTA